MYMKEASAKHFTRTTNPNNNSTKIRIDSKKKTKKFRIQINEQ